MNNIIQQNKNKFNKISALLSAETKKNNKEISSSRIARKGYINILPNQSISLTITMFPKVSPSIKVVEGNGKIFWCWEISCAELQIVQGRHLDPMSGDPQSIHDRIYGLLSHELNEKIASWKKTFRDGILDPYFPNGLDDTSSAFRDIQGIFESLFEDKISIKREESILKTIKDPNLYPILWYNMSNNGSYSVQRRINYSDNVSVAERAVIEVPVFEREMARQISNTVDYSTPNIDNWSVVEFSDVRFRNLGGTIASMKY